ncbi:MAG: hypothetical protein ACLFV7_04025 [Phycisphaerae bacterium]
MARTPRIYATMIAVLLVGTLTSAAAGKTFPIARTDYTIIAPDNWLLLPGGKNMLLNVQAPGGSAVVQALGRPDGAKTLGDMIKAYEARLNKEGSRLQLQHNSALKVAGVKAPFRRYTVTIDGVELELQAVFFVKGQDVFVLTALADAGKRAEMRKILLSLTGKATAPAAKTIKLPDTQYTLKLPAGWLLKRTSEAGRFTAQSPDGKTVVTISRRKTSEKITGRSLIDAAAKAYIDGLRRDVQWKPVEDQNERVAGIPGRYVRHVGMVGGEKKSLLAMFIQAPQTMFTLTAAVPEGNAELMSDTMEILRSIRPAGEAKQGENARPILYRDRSTGLQFQLPGGFSSQETAGAIRYTGPEAEKLQDLSITVQPIRTTARGYGSSAEAATTVQRVLKQRKAAVAAGKVSSPAGVEMQTVAARINMNRRQWVIRYFLTERNDVVLMVRFTASADDDKTMKPIVRNFMKTLRTRPQD